MYEVEVSTNEVSTNGKLVEYKCSNLKFISVEDALKW